MATLTVWRFDSPDGAEAVLGKLAELQQQDLIAVNDAAIVRWDDGKNSPKTEQMRNLAGLGALDGSFWGLLFGMLFFMPLLGMAVGAVSGAISGALTDIGIDDNFIERVRKEVTPGTSALFLMTSNEVVDRVHQELGGMELIASNLTSEQESALAETFSQD